MGLSTLLVAATILTPPGGREADRAGRLWFELGHRVVARLAERRLTPQAAEAVREILAGQSLADASLWADQIRGRRPETGPLHYVNIPLAASSYDPANCGERGCIISEIERDRRVLADTGASAVDKGEALRFLIHLVGDLHQPLHVSDNDDHGGNLTQVQFGGRGTNLHEVWDGRLIEVQWGTDEQAYLDHLLEEMRTLDLAALERGTVIDWAMEGHRIAAEGAYDFPRNRQLGDAYVERNLPLVDLAIIKAGVRLARLLNEAFASHTPGMPAPALPAGTYSDREAAAHVGEEATVVGMVVTVHRTASGNFYLNFGADYPHQTFSGAVLNPRDPALLRLDGLVGKRVGIRGLIKIYKGQAEIVIERIGQIEVME